MPAGSCDGDMVTKDFAYFMKCAVESWPFDEENYEELRVRLAGCTSKDERKSVVVKFAIEHILKHIQKSEGVLAELLERSDHNRFNFNTKDPTQRLALVSIFMPVVGKLLFSVFRLAEVVGMEPVEVVGAVEGLKGWQDLDSPIRTVL